MQLKISNLASKARLNYYKRLLQAALGDILVVFIAYAFAISAWSFNNSNIDYAVATAMTVFIAIVFVSTCYGFGVYQRIWTRTSGHGITVIINAAISATVIIVGVSFFFSVRPIPLRFLFLGNLLVFGGLVAIRFRSRMATSFVWRWNAVIRREFPEPRSRVLIIGAGESGQTLAWRLMHRFNTHHYQVVGFIDDDPDKQNMYVEGVRIVGMRQDIEQVAERLDIDLIVVAIHNISGPDFRDVLTACENTKALIKVVPDLEAMVSARQSAVLLRDVQAEDLIGRSMVTRHEAVDLTPITNKVILITGAAGSIGSELSRQIIQYQPTRTILLDNNESGLHDLLTELQSKHPGIDIVAALVDITMRGALRSIFEKHQPQIVFHAAAYKHVPMLEYYPREALRVNIGGTRNVAELAREFDVERFVLISTDKAVNPSSIMGASKRICELMLHALSQDETCHTLFTSVRFGNVLGSRGSVVPTFNRQIDSGGPVTVTHQEMTRYFMSIPEAVNLIMHAACLTHGNDIYVLRMGEVVRIVELAERMIRLRGLRPYKDIEIKFTGMRPGEKMHEELFHGAEVALETVHPKIMKVDTGDTVADWTAFWEQVDQLLQEMPDNPPTVIGKLRELIRAEQGRSLSQQPNNTNVRVV